MEKIKMYKLFYKVLGVLIILLCIFIIEQSTHKYYYTEYGELVNKHFYATVDGIGIEYMVKESFWMGTSIPVFASIFVGVIIGLILLVRTNDVILLYNINVRISSLLLISILNAPILLFLVYLYVEDFLYFELISLLGIIPFLIISGLYKHIDLPLLNKILLLFFPLAFIISVVTISGFTQTFHHHGDWGQIDLNGFTLFDGNYGTYYLHTSGFISFRILNAILLIMGGIIYISSSGFRKFKEK